MPTNETIDTTLQIFNLANAALPGILKIISLIRDADPNMTVGDLWAQTDAILAANREQIAEWKRTHPEPIV